MTKKLFIKLSMLLFVLGMSTNVAWGTNFSGMTDEQAETMAFWARLTAKFATTTTGTGKVFVSEDEHPVTPEDGDYASTYSADGFSDVYVQTSLVDGDVHFRTYAISDPGSYFIGWSFTDGSTDLGNYERATNFEVQMTPSSKKGHGNIHEQIIYAAFNKVQIASYEFVDDNNTTADDGEGNWTCTQSVKFRVQTPNAWSMSSLGDVIKHIKLPVVTRKAGTTGTWSTSVDEWTNANVTAYGEYAELTVPVTFVAPNGDPSEYAAELVLETYAGVKMKVYLYARTSGSSDKDIALYDGKTFQKNLDWSEFDEEDLSGYTNPIVKLNKNATNTAITIAQSLTLDLNGYNMQYLTGTALTVNAAGKEVTLAYSPYGGQIQGWQRPSVQVLAGKVILNGGTIMCGNSYAVAVASGAELVQNGATIGGKTAAIASQGKVTTTDGYMKGLVGSTGAGAELIINGGTFDNTAETVSGVTFAAGVAIEIGGGSAQIKKGVIRGGTYGVQTSGGSATISKLAVVSGNTKALKGASGSLTVDNGKFTNPDNLYDGTITFNAGYFQTVTGPTALGKQVWRNTAGAEARAGYAFFVGDQATAQANNVSVCRIGQASYSSLEDALTYANNNPSQGVVIVMENDYTLKAGYYTLPANATLIVPMSDDQQVANPVVPRSSGIENPISFRKLIFANGVNMTVAGTLELTCTQYGSGETMGVPGGNFGHLIMKPGSHMTINNGGELRAWGFVSGDGTKDAQGNYLSGEIDVRRGGVVREMFQMGDWKGGDISFTIAMELPDPSMPNYRDMTHLFPVYTYFIQNVESPVKYHPGSSLICATSVNVSGSINAFANEIKVVGKNGEAAMFLMDEMADAENTWVRKFYDAKNDKQVYEVNSGAQLGSLVIELGEVPGMMFGAPGTLKLELDSRKFVLPLTSNFKIHLLSGNMQFTQSTSCLPGMEVEIDKESEIAIINQDREGVVEGALYLYDADQWSFQNTQAKGYVGNSGNFGAIVRYSPTWDLDPSKPSKPNVRDISSPAAIGDAILNVHGTFRMGENCAVYTTWSKDMSTFGLDNSESASGGASIISTNEDAGTFIFDADAPAAFQGLIWDFSDPENPQIVGFNPDVLVNYDHNNYGLGTQYPIQIQTVLKKTERVFGVEFCTSAKLTNGDGTFEETQGMTASTSYCYMNGKWTTMAVAEESECFMKDQDDIFYAKPSEYVAVVASVDGSGNVVGNDDHTFSDKAGAGRLFILTADEMGTCDEWWEVEKKDNLYHCIHPNNDTYYYWDDTEGRWMEQRFTITWKNWDGKEIKSYTEDPNSHELIEVEYSVTYGTQAEYLGEVPTREANIDYTYDFTGWSPELGPVKSDVTYTATYKEQPRKYTIIFQNEGGDEIERHFLTHNEWPVCENVPTRAGNTLEWEPALASVTGDATYRATWLENPPTEYEIAFVDYDGQKELQRSTVAVGLMPTPPANPAGKPATSEFTYVFDHWSPAITKVSQSMTYTAVYREEARKYTIRYFKENGTTPNETKASESLEYGATPTPPVVAKEDPETGHTYTLVWKTLDESSNIQTVMGDASYKPTYIDELNRYTVTVKSNPSGACSFIGAGLYDYNTSATLTLSVNTGYTFTGWSDDLEGTSTSRTITVTEDKELVANFTVTNPDYTITWKNENGTANLVAPVGQKENTATIYPGATPTKEATVAKSFTFYGWSTQVGTEENEWNYGTIYKNGLTPKATADATYYAHFSSTVNTYKVTLTSNPLGAGTLAGAGSYNYGDAVDIRVVSYNTDNYNFDGWSGDVPTTVTGNINLTANFSPITYTVTWKNEDGSATLETDESQVYGAETAYNGADQSKTVAGYTCTFDGWTTEANGEGSFYSRGNTPVVTGNATYFAHFSCRADNLEVGMGTENLTEATEKNNLIITSNGVNASGQLTGSEYLHLQGTAYFDYAVNAQARTWYAVAVPWQVDARTGISVNGRTLTLGKDFDILYYNSAGRAAGGEKSWNYLEHDGEKTMKPGTLYMIALMKDAPVIRFAKKAGAEILTTSVSVELYPSDDPSKANWNGIANPALYYAYMNVGATYGQTYNATAVAYNPAFEMSSHKFIVGEPVFVQAPNPKTAVANAGSYPVSAPRRERVSDEQTRYQVEMAQDGKITDRIFLHTDDEKANEYIIGQDLVKMGTNKAAAQMWINRYDVKLCVNTTAFEDGVATYPLSISAPSAGEATIYVVSQPNDNNDLYLTLDGQAIWNLSSGAYTLNLNKGTDARYGLRISAKTPQVTTGTEEINAEKNNVRKLLIDNKIYIIRGKNVYTTDGKLVK